MVIKTLLVGTKLRSKYPLYNPVKQVEYPVGTIFEVASLGVDNRFGFYQVHVVSTDIKLAGHYMMYSIQEFEVIS